MKKNGFFYGWIVCIVCMAVAFCTMGFLNTSISAFLPYMREYAGISNTQCSMLTMVRNITSVIVMSQVDVFLKKMGLRKGLLTGIGFTLAALVTLALSRSFPLYCLGMVFAGFGYALSGLVSISIVMARWFVSHRTFAVSLCSMGTGIASVVLPPAITTISNRYSLPVVFAAAAVFTVIVIAAVLLLMPEGPEKKGLTALDNGDPAEKAKKHSEITADKHVLIFICIGLGVLGIATYGAVPNMALLFKTEGITEQHTAVLLSLYGVLMTTGKLAYGAAADHFGAFRSTILFFIFNFTGVFLMSACGTTFGPVAATAGCILYGLGNALATIAHPVLASAISRDEDYPKMVKRLQLSYTIGSVLIGPVPGMIADVMGSYSPAYVLFGCQVVLAVIMVSLGMRQYRKMPVL